MTQDLIFMLIKGQTLVEVAQSDGTLIKVPQWKANGAPSFNAWVHQQAAWVRQQASSATPSVPQGAGPTLAREFG
jgi:hypothetical protein